jgi:malate dehydrogenase (oxaloacetate-decarboxylating)
MAGTCPGYSVTVRVEAPATIGATADLAAAVLNAGGALTALDVVESKPAGHRRRRDLQCKRCGPR